MIEICMTFRMTHGAYGKQRMKRSVSWAFKWDIMVAVLKHDDSMRVRDCLHV